ncbi:PREDICTED: spermatid-associated protein [Mesitornis unicolor]|uniref:spermatid-associated protein n=1 Tax=Mesitornis unicolor TaxID=54374 RepID=UPI0005291AC0|nr:PREDICTED: spermatid-associated protein [Mesitornis unicolor]
MSAFDLMNQSTQVTELEIDCIAPWMKLRDEHFVFADGKRMNEIYCQSPSASHRKIFTKKVQNEWSIWEENRALWEENQVLQTENKMLREENKALQCLQSQNRAIQVIYPDAIQQNLNFQKENKLFPFFRERNIGLQVSPGNKDHHVVREKKIILEDSEQRDKTVPIISEDEQDITVHEESKDSSSDLQEDTDAITAVEEGNPGPAPQEEHEAKDRSTTSTQNKIRFAPSMQNEYEILQALQYFYKLLHIFLKVNYLLGEKQGCQILYDVNRPLQEDYDKLKLQLNAVKNTVSDIVAQMEMLENELIAITSTL